MAYLDYFTSLLERCRFLYNSHPSIYCPYLKAEVICNAEGFTHLLYKTNRQPRSVSEKSLKLKLLKKALLVIRNAGTLQEYRRMGKIEYWAFHDVVGVTNMFLIRIIVRKVGNGPFHFWSVMPIGKIQKSRVYKEGLEDH